jgi:hypothetical protein
VQFGFQNFRDLITSKAKVAAPGAAVQRILPVAGIGFAFTKEIYGGDKRKLRRQACPRTRCYVVLRCVCALDQSMNCADEMQPGLTSAAPKRAGETALWTQSSRRIAVAGARQGRGFLHRTHRKFALAVKLGTAAASRPKL